MEKTFMESAEERVKALLDEMPTTHRSQFKQLSQDEFEALVSELGRIRKEYGSEAGASHQSRLAGRYEKVFRTLVRCVSLRLLGVPRKALQFQINQVVEKKEPESVWRQARPGVEVGSYEETYSQPLTSAG